jgi:cytochrome c biogenesis protein CcmG, thiol:disulfide interchange protein DsbE
MIDRALVAAFAVGLAGLLWITSTSVEARVVAIGERAPRFSVVTDDGRTLTPDNFGGKLLMINFWATWCAPCALEMPSLSQFADSMRGKGVVVLAISIDEHPGPYRQFLDRLKGRFLTTRDASLDIASSFGTFKIPETYVIDTRGRVARKYVDARDWMDSAILADFEAMLQ